MLRPTAIGLAFVVMVGCEGSLGVSGPDGTRAEVDAGALSDAASPPGSDAFAATTDAFLATPDAFLASPDAFTTPGCGTPVEQAQLALTNAARVADGRAPLRCDVLMTMVARAHSQDMCDRRYFSHTNLEGLSPFQRMRAAGVSYSTAGENIAQGQRTAEDVHTSWMNSPGHRANILNGAYGRIGIGLSECGGRMYWTQIFAN